MESESEKLVGRLRDYMTMEQEFYHLHFMSRAKEVDSVPELIEILDLLHANYLVQKRLFSQLAQAVAESGVELPPLKSLLKP
tara:strand:+ start:498 stop:743 length:246 start_codon:yes stop_codon:yes gene_type:complete